MKTQFLLDENLSIRLKKAVLQFDSQIDILRVGEPETPPLGTLDPEILEYLEMSRRILITDNRSSMPAHLSEHWNAGQQIWGLLWVRPSASLRDIAEAIYIVWEASDAEEWIDTLDWIPF